jgi:hypothetical protein
MDNGTSVFSAEQESKYLRDTVVGARITNAWARPDGYVLEFDHKLRLEVGSAGADWFRLEPEMMQARSIPVC